MHGHESKVKALKQNNHLLHRYVLQPSRACPTTKLLPGKGFWNTHCVLVVQYPDILVVILNASKVSGAKPLNLGIFNFYVQLGSLH
ncbi:hypothetical protein FKM82_017854 [Ascaphus truei]